MYKIRKFLMLAALLILGSYLCFYPTNHRRLEDWALFLIVFFMTFLGVALFFQSTWPHIKPRPMRKKKEQEALFDALEDGILILDCNGCILETNKQARFFLKSSKSKLIGHQLIHLKNSSLIEICAYLFQKCNEMMQDQSTSISIHDSLQSSFEITVKPLLKVNRFLILIRDASKQYQMHQLGKDFVANASHELRTPITIIKGFAETLRDLPEVSEDMFQDFTEKMIRNCQRMDQLVKNLLTLNDLDYMPKLKLQECDLVALVDNCIYTLLAVHPECHVEALQNKEIIMVLADPDLLELAVMNILENGVKYSSAPAHLTVTIEECEKKVKLTVADKGVGIAESDIKRIFDRFYTVDKTHSRRLGGAGLGLSIVQAIMKKHHSQIQIESACDKGTSLTLVFGKITQKKHHFFQLDGALRGVQ